MLDMTDRKKQRTQNRREIVLKITGQIIGIEKTISIKKRNLSSNITLFVATV